MGVYMKKQENEIRLQDKVPKDSDPVISGLAERLGVSRATVSKTVRHCSGVDTATRERILREMRRIGIPPAAGVCDIYSILPDIPSFFWKGLQHGLAAETEALAGKALTVKTNVYSKPRDDETVLYYLEEAEAMQARCIVIAAVITERIREKLCAVCRRADRLVLLLSEYGDVPNSFYIGSDAYADGAEMARRFAQFRKTRYSVPQQADSPSLSVLSVDGNKNVTERLMGFRDTLAALPETRHTEPRILTLDAYRLSAVKTLPSYLAAVLSEISVPHVSGTDPDTAFYLYVPMGCSGLPLALKKAGIAGNTVCFCHDTIPDSRVSGTGAFSACICLQNVEEQGRAAARCAVDYIMKSMYPARKKQIVPSLIRMEGPVFRGQ